MIPYLLLMILAMMGSFVSVKKRKGKIHIGDNDYIKENNVSIWLFFFGLFLLMSLRAISIGRDLAGYERFFMTYNKMGWGALASGHTDILYVVLNLLVGKITDNFQLFIAVTSALTLLPIAIQYSREKRYSYLKIILFMNMPVFIMFFSGLRQSIAIAMGVISYELVKRKKLICFILIVIIAIGFHHSAFILLALYPIYHIRLKRKHLFIIIPILVSVFVFNRQLFEVLTQITYTIFGEDYDKMTSSTGAYTMLILFLIFVVLAYVMLDEMKCDKETMGLRNIMVFVLMLQCFAPVHSLAMRMNYYFIVFVPMAIPKFLLKSKQRYRTIAKMATIVMVLFFTLYYLYNTYLSCKTGVSTLDTYPYIPFWRYGN